MSESPPRFQQFAFDPEDTTGAVVVALDSIGRFWVGTWDADGIAWTKATETVRESNDS